MTIRFTTEEVRRLVLMGVYESHLLRHVEGRPTISLHLDDDGSVCANLEVEFDSDEPKPLPTEHGGSN